MKPVSQALSRAACLLAGLLLGQLFPATAMAQVDLPDSDRPPGPAESDRRLEEGRAVRQREVGRLRVAGDVAYAKGQVYQAIEDYNRALSMLGDIDVETHIDLDLKLGRAQASLGDCEGAQESLRQATGGLSGNLDRATGRQSLAASINALCPR